MPWKVTCPVSERINLINDWLAFRPGICPSFAGPVSLDCSGAAGRLPQRFCIAISLTRLCPARGSVARHAGLEALDSFSYGFAVFGPGAIGYCRSGCYAVAGTAVGGALARRVAPGVRVRLGLPVGA